MPDKSGDCAGMPETYRGWEVSLSAGGEDWRATGPNYTKFRDHECGECYVGTVKFAATREELISAIDAWILDNGQ